MLEKIRSGVQGPFVKIVLGLIIIAFALTGVNAYLGGSADDYVAKVEQHEISKSQMDRAYQAQRERLQEQLGDMFDYFANDDGYATQMRHAVLEELIEERLSILFAEQLGLQKSPDGMRNYIHHMPEFQVNGQFNVDVYNRALMNIGMNSNQFVRYMQEQVLRVQALQAILYTDFALEQDASWFERLSKETREGQYLLVSGATLEEQVELEPQEVEAWYYENAQRFEVAEQIELEYIELDFEQVLAQVQVTEQQVQDYYDRNKQAYTKAEKREIAHILFEFGSQESDAMEKAEQAYARLQAGEDFAAVAAEVSEDRFSAKDGGYLGLLERGSIDPDIEDAGFALQEVGQYSEVVRSEFGYHIVQLFTYEPQAETPFTEVHDDIYENLVRVEAENEYFKRQQELARITFEVPDTLSIAADALGVDVKTSPWIVRNAPAPEFDDAAFIQQAFSSDVTQRDLNSEVIELDGRSVVVRKHAYEPAHTQPLDNVKEQIAGYLVAQKAQDLAYEQAIAYQNQLEQGEAVEGNFVSFTGLERTGDEAPQEVVSQVFKMPVYDDSASYAVVRLNTGDVALVAVTSAHLGEATEDDADYYAGRIESNWSNRFYESLLASLKSKADIKRKRL